MNGWLMAILLRGGSMSTCVIGKHVMQQGYEEGPVILIVPFEDRASYVIKLNYVLI